jgi:hypothetical protein
VALAASHLRLVLAFGLLLLLAAGCAHTEPAADAAAIARLSAMIAQIEAAAIATPTVGPKAAQREALERTLEQLRAQLTRLKYGEAGPPPAAPGAEAGGRHEGEPAAAPVALEPAPANARLTGVPLGPPPEQVAGSEPPDPVYEEQPPAPEDDSVWIPGFWDWAGQQWVWVYGGWSERVRGAAYVPPYYEVVNGSVVVIRGHWRRGAEPVRSWGGRPITWRSPVRPSNYRPGFREVARPSGGLAVGTRPVLLYGGAVAATRPAAALPLAARPILPPRAYGAAALPHLVPGHAPGVHVTVPTHVHVPVHITLPHARP